MPLIINDHLSLGDDEIQLSAIRAQGKGGQNVNKVSSAIQLRFDIPQSSLPERSKRSLLAMNDSRISKDGVLVIKSQEWRTQEKNKEAAFERLRELILASLIITKRRIATKPSFGAKQRRLDGKTKRGGIKSNRKKVDW